MHDLSLAEFDADKRRFFEAAVATTLGKPPGRVAVTGARAGSVIADVRVTASNIHFAPNLADVTTETIEFSRTGANLSYASSVRNFGGKELSRRTISFMNANDGTINVFDSDGESAIDFILTK